MPDREDIERASRRPRPPADPGLDGYKKFVTRSTTVLAIFVIAGCLCLAAAATADIVLGLGWGFGWKEFWGALAVGVFGALLYLASRAWFELIGFYPLRDHSQLHKRKHP
jgi:hypothetical protein